MYFLQYIQHNTVHILQSFSTAFQKTRYKWCLSLQFRKHCTCSFPASSAFLLCIYYQTSRDISKEVSICLQAFYRCQHKFTDGFCLFFFSPLWSVAFWYSSSISCSAHRTKMSSNAVLTKMLLLHST